MTGRAQPSGGCGSGDRGSSDRGLGDRGSGDRGSGDRGSGTVLALTVVMLAGLLLVMVSAVGQAVLARHRAQAAADLAALAAASAQPTGGTAPGSADACSEAARVASANGARLAGCRAGADVVVRVRVGPSGSGPLPALAPAEGSARAGPAAPSP